MLEFKNDMNNGLVEEKKALEEKWMKTLIYYPKEWFDVK
jgi:hypothetical protein